MVPNLDGKTLYCGPAHERIPATQNAGYIVHRPISASNRHLGHCLSYDDAVTMADKAAQEAIYPTDGLVEVHAIAKGWGDAECCLYIVCQGEMGKHL